MTKTIAIALAITASLVGSESFAGDRALGLGQSVTLQHKITIHPRDMVEVGRAVLKYGDRYLLQVEDASPRIGPNDIITGDYRAFELELNAIRVWDGNVERTKTAPVNNHTLRFWQWATGTIDPGRGNTVNLEFVAKDDKFPVGHEREYRFYVRNNDYLNSGPVKIKLHNITPTIGLPPVLFDD